MPELELEHVPDVADRVAVGIEVNLRRGALGLKSAEQAWAAIGEILDGKGRPDDLVGLVRQLQGEHHQELATQLAKAATVAAGDVIIEVGELISAPAHSILAAGIASKKKPTPARLQRYLASVTGTGAAAFEPGVVTFIVGKLGTHDFVEVFPRVTKVHELHTQPELLRWLVKSPPAIVAHLMGISGSNALGAKLQELDLWKPWIDHIIVAHHGYNAIANGATGAQPDVIQKLMAPYGVRATQTPDGRHEVEIPDLQPGDQLEAAIATGASRTRLLAAINDAGWLDNPAGTLAALRRARATADDILDVAGLVIAPETMWLQALLEAPGITAVHVLTYTGQNPLDLSTLSDPIVRQLRARLGAMSLRQLVPKHDQKSHKAVVEVETLRQWFLKDALPDDLFWFCTQTPALVTKATRVVVSRFPDWAWVRKLTGAEDPVQLRSLALACNDPTIAKFIREELVHDSKGVASFGGEATSANVYGGAQNRLDLAIAMGERDNVMERLADLSDAERRMFAKDEVHIAELMSRGGLDAFTFARAAQLLDLTFAVSLRHAPKGKTLLSYLRSRPAAEEVAALADPKLVAHAADVVTRDLLLVFPSLANRTVLAKALANDPNLLELLLSGSDPHRVLELIAVEPAATPAIESFSNDLDAMRKIPAYAHLLPAGRGFVDRMAKSSLFGNKGRDVLERIRTESPEERLQQVDPDERASVERANTIQEFRAIAALPEALDQALATGTSDTLAAVLASHKTQVPELLTERKHEPRVAKLARRLQIAPDIACPFISIDLLLQMPNALRWYFDLFDRIVLLRHVKRPGVASLVGQNLGGDSAGARDWLRALPRGAALSADERHALDLLEQSTITREVLRELFFIRYDVPAPASYDAGDLDSLYRVASRLPPAHLNQKRITAIATEDNVVRGADGVYNQALRRVSIGTAQHEGKGEDEFHPASLEGKADDEWMTGEELKKAFGYDEPTFANHLRSKNIIANEVEGQTFYKMRPVPVDSFTQVVLHEIGHSIDHLLGSRTDIVYKFADWHEFNDNQFDVWAGEMGGWNHVTAGDKVKIRQAWIDAARVNASVKSLVSEDHPALSRSYEDAGVGIVQMGREGASFGAWTRTIVNGRMFVAGSYIGRWYSVPESIVTTAPSFYSLYAPAEYFAESYVEYYRQVDGSPGSEKKKGGALATPVKQFFDQRVDALRFDPARFDKPAP
ncbi:MAG: hypothetical protein ABI867_01500 [Kofleriaceae bacterium]